MLCAVGLPSPSNGDGDSVIDGPDDSEHYTFYYGDSFRHNYNPEDASSDNPQAQLKSRMMRLRATRPDRRRSQCVEAVLAPNIGIAYEHISTSGTQQQKGPFAVERMDNIFGPLVDAAAAALPPSPKYSMAPPPRAPLDCQVAQHDSMVILFRGHLVNKAEIRELYREALAGAQWLGPSDLPPSPRTMNDAELLLALAFDHMQTLRAEAQGPKAEQEVMGMSRPSMYRTQQFLGSLKGPFAFMILDVEEKEVFAARDAVGLSELYWSTFQDGSMLFSSDRRFMEPEGEPAESFPAGSYFLGKWNAKGWQMNELHSFILNTGSVPRVNSRGQICKVASGGDLPSMTTGTMIV